MKATSYISNHPKTKNLNNNNIGGQLLIAFGKYGYFNHLSPVMAQITGFTINELKQQSFFDLIYKSDKPKFIEAIYNLKLRGTKQVISCRLICKNRVKTAFTFKGIYVDESDAILGFAINDENINGILNKEKEEENPFGELLLNISKKAVNVNKLNSLVNYALPKIANVCKADFIMVKRFLDKSEPIGIYKRDAVKLNRKELIADQTYYKESKTKSKNKKLNGFLVPDYMRAAGMQEGLYVTIEDKAGGMWGVICLYGRQKESFSNTIISFIQTIGIIFSETERRIEAENNLKFKTK